MRKSALIVLVGVCVAALLLITAGTRLGGFEQPDPYAAIAWLAAILAFAVFVVMLAEYAIHGRTVHLYLGGAFMSVAVMGVWDTLTFKYSEAFVPADRWHYFAAWMAQWITLALALIFAIVANRGPGLRRRRRAMLPVVAAGVVWASIVIFVIVMFPSVPRALGSGNTGMIVSAACAVLFALALLAYTRPTLNKGNAVLLWMSYGLIFAILAQVAMAVHDEPTESLFVFAGLMKVLTFLAPLAGMLAEHTRLQTRLHEQSSDLNHLIQAQQAVSTITSQQELFGRIVDLVRTSMRAVAVCLLPFEGDRGLLRVAASAGLDEQAAKQLVFRPGEGPIGESYSGRETVLVRDVSDEPALVQKMGAIEGVRSAVFAPLTVRDECLGVLAVFLPGRPISKLSKEQVRLLEALASQAALAVDEFRLQGRVQDSSRTSGDYARELEIVWEIGQAVASQLDLHALVDTLSERLRDAVGAKTCSVLVFEPDVMGLKVLGGGKVSRYHSVEEHNDRCDATAIAVATRGEPLIISDVPNSRHCKFPDLANEDGGTHHVLVVPMSLPGFTGAISVFRQNAEPFGEKEKKLLMRLSPMVAVGIRNAQLYDREKKIAESLQKSFLPEVERERDGIQIAGRYQAARDETLVGGDFYDVIELEDGRFGVAIGDVSGKGIDAAVYTAMARYMIQAYSADDPDPVYVISKLNAALCRYTPVGKFVTLVYGLVDTKAGTFTYTNAGHELPFIHRGEEGKIDELTTTGPAAGALVDGEYTSEQVEFRPGDMLILYTDGATEARHGDQFLGTEGLRKIVAEHIHKGVHDLPEHILQAIRSYARGHLRDDVAILVVKSRKPGALF